MEGKDIPWPLGQKEYNDLGKRVIVMLMMCRPIFGSWKDVVLDSGFFVAKGIADLKTKGVYVKALIKKRRYYPKWVPDDWIDTQFEYREVGDVERI